MRILIAPDKFKGSLSANEAAKAIARGVARVDASIEIDHCPIADGGEGTVDILARELDPKTTRYHETEVAGPLGPSQRVRAKWLMLEARPAGSFNSHGQDARATDSHGRDARAVDRSHDPQWPVAVLELASAAGFSLVSEAERNPMRTTTFGLGELMRLAIHAGCRTLIVTLGGSATCDGACGLAQALGARFMFDDGPTRGPDEAHAPITGRDLASIRAVDASAIDQLLNTHNITVITACDVRNPLLGPHGAARTYGPQKGATPAEVEHLERGLTRLVQTCFPNVDSTFEGAGAAGGAGFGLHALARARIRSGIETILDLLGFDGRLARSDLVITGEGRLDAQSRYGKAAYGVAQRAAAAGVPLLLLAGAIDAKKGSGVFFDIPDASDAAAIELAAIADLPGVTGPVDAMDRAEALLADLAEATFRRHPRHQTHRRRK